MNAVTTSAAHATLDVRSIHPRERHARIFGTFQGLAAGQSMDIVNDHDPRPLYAHFQSVFPGRFSWDALEQGPEVWRVRVARVGRGDLSEPCCGSCGG